MIFFDRNIFFLILVITINLATNYVSKLSFDFDILFNEMYSNQLTHKQIEKIVSSRNKWFWLEYLLIPLLVLVRVFLVALCLSIGMFFYEMENKLKFTQFFRIALRGEFVLVFVGIAKLLYFLFIKTDYTLQDIQQYYPLSYLNFLDIDHLEPWLIYPLQTVNLFEIAYFFVLVYGLHKLLKNKYWKSFEITAASYGTGLAIWLGLVMFLILNMS